MKFSENLRRYRIAAGWRSAKEFAAALGVPYTTYAPYENAQREPRFDTLCKIAAALHVSIDVLLKGDDADRKASYEIIKSKIEDIRVTFGSACAVATTLSLDLERGKPLSGEAIHEQMEFMLSTCEALHDKIWIADRYTRLLMK